ncbi:hypothetical protein CBS101457_005117 [Exobasidium rhododendri]|nr:hypothetical protein CBS101457_005117 [Exobasidium rhododendri]
MVRTTLFVLALLQAISVRAGVTLPAEPVDKSTPVQQRVSFHGPESISVAWNTFQQTSKPCVQYGTSTNNMNQVACSTVSITYPSSRTWSNLVTINNLKAATVYYYKVVSTNSTVAQFMSPRSAGDKTSFKMVTLADLGLYGLDGYTTTKRELIPQVDPVLNHTTIGRLANTVNDYEFIIHPGDFAYADDWIEDPSNYLDSEAAYTAIIERFYTQLEPISSNKPYMVSPGNHEANCQEIPYTASLCPPGQYNFSDFSNRFNGMMPTTFASTSKVSDSQSSRNYAKMLAHPPFWYSFDYGMVHVVMIDTETDFDDAPDQPGGSANLDAGPVAPSGQQLKFLDADLASVDRTITPWVIVAGHRPWYTVGDSSTPCAPCQAAFEGLLYKYGVDLALFGHVHNLQRFAPIYNGTVDPAGYNNPKAPAYTVIGGPGNIEGHSDITPVTAGNKFAYNANFGYGQLTFFNTTHLGMDFYRSMDGANLDSSVLVKDHTTQFVRQ